MGTAQVLVAQPAQTKSARDAAALAVIERATDVIGNRDHALRWLGTPVRALNYATPVSLLGSKKGRDAILATLHNLEHGVL